MLIADLDGVPTYYDVQGHGSPLVLVTGLAADHQTWENVLPELATQHTCLVLDQRGTGSAVAFPPASTKQLADDLALLVTDLGLPPAHVCGVSMGGCVALELAIRHPEVVRSLSLHSTWARTDPLLEAAFDLRKALLLEAGPSVMRRYVAVWAYGASFCRRHGDRDLAALLDEHVGSDPSWSEERIRSYLAHVDVAIRHDCARRLAEIQAPTLVTVGDEDILTPARFAREIAGGISDCELDVWPGVGHASLLEAADVFVRRQLAWCEQHDDVRA